MTAMFVDDRALDFVSYQIGCYLGLVGVENLKKWAKLMISKQHVKLGWTVIKQYVKLGWTVINNVITLLLYLGLTYLAGLL